MWTCSRGASPSLPRGWGVALAAALAFVMQGCATTGDPRQGGLFGWSEREATERERTLREEARDAQAAVQAETDAGRTAQEQAARLRRQELQAQGELDRLLSENDGLQDRLRQLMSQSRLGKQDLARLNGVLAGNSRNLAALRKRQAETPVRPVTAIREVDEQNESLRREVRHLLQR